MEYRAHALVALYRLLHRLAPTVLGRSLSRCVQGLLDIIGYQGLAIGPLYGIGGGLLNAPS
eukprot:2506126-Pyramimonas_sp.AAC.1